MSQAAYPGRYQEIRSFISKIWWLVCYRQKYRWHFTDAFFTKGICQLDQNNKTTLNWIITLQTLICYAGTQCLKNECHESQTEEVHKTQEAYLGHY